MWRKISIFVFLFVGGGCLSLACDLPPFDPRGFRCGTDLDCLQGYVCQNKVCELAVTVEGSPDSTENPESSDASEPVEGAEPKPETTETSPEQQLEKSPEKAPEASPEPKSEPKAEPLPEKTPEKTLDGGEPPSESRTEQAKEGP
ncbi:MAG: hypothetical protein H6727_13085 [Myxococcales bacterium]|nr:hypothetical protein [Myxococcales bacterium]